MNVPVDHGAEVDDDPSNDLTYDPHADPDAEQEPPFKPLTPEEALAWRAQNPLMSPWRIVAAQAVLGLVCAMVVWGVTQRSSAWWSALYGMAVVVVPGALMARGLATSVQNGAKDPAAAAIRFMVWELVKMALAVAMLVAAAKFAPDLSWPAMLVTLAVCMKMGWLVLLWRRRPVV